MQVLTDGEPGKKPEDYNPIELQKLTRYSVDSFVDPNYRGWLRDNLWDFSVKFFQYDVVGLTNPKKREAWLSDQLVENSHFEESI